MKLDITVDFEGHDNIDLDEDFFVELTALILKSHAEKFTTISVIGSADGDEDVILSYPFSLH